MAHRKASSYHFTYHFTVAGIAPAVPNMAWAFGIDIVIDLFIRKEKIRI